MQITMAKLILGMLRRGNLKAIKMLSKQLRMNRGEMVKVAKHLTKKK